VQLCGGALFLDDLGLLVPWPPYPLQLTEPTRALPCLRGERSQVETRARVGDPVLTGDLGGDSGYHLWHASGQAFGCWHGFAHVCVPDPVSLCGNDHFQSVSQLSLPVWPVLSAPLHRHGVSSAAHVCCSGCFSIFPAALFLNVFIGCPLSLLLWSWAFPQMASLRWKSLRSGFLFPPRNKHLLSSSASSLSFFSDLSQC